jgi:hypothetical protein
MLQNVHHVCESESTSAVLSFVPARVLVEVALFAND